jgi:hypothetical protein
MSRVARAVSTAMVAYAALLAAAAPAIACQVCFGDPNAPLTKSAEMGVWVLLGTILLVEAAFAVFFFVYLRRRVRNVRDPMPRPALRLIKKGA